MIESRELLVELKSWLDAHSKKCRELQRDAAKQGDSHGERCYHGMNSAYINASNGVDSLLKNGVLNYETDTRN